MKLNEFNEKLKNSSKFHIENKSDQLSVDDFIMPNAYRKPYYFRKIAFSVMSLLVVLVFSFYIYTSSTPVSILTIDINPSIVVELNRFNRIVTVSGTDQDGMEFVSDLDLKSNKLDDLLEKIYSKGIEEGYFTESNAAALVGIYGEDFESENELNQIVTSFSSINFLAINQHFESDDLRIGSDLTVAYEITYESVASGDLDSYLENPGTIPEFTTTNGIVNEEELRVIVNDYGLSATQLGVIIYIFENSDDYTTYNDLITLVNLSISSLIDLYNDIN